MDKSNKVTEESIENETVEETAKAETKVKSLNTYDPWKDMVTIRLPRPVGGEENFIIASVNGKVFKVQKGVSVDVPAPIAEVIQNSFSAQDEAYDFIQSKGSNDTEK